jgi:hypothetical protein
MPSPNDEEPGAVPAVEEEAQASEQAGAAAPTETSAERAKRVAMSAGKTVVANRATISKFVKRLRS